MRRIAIILAAAAMLTAGVPAAVAGGGGGCHEDQHSEGTGTAVSLKDFCFAPTVIHIRPGETVTWTNIDDAPHTVTGMPGTFDSDELTQGQKFTHRFADPGTFGYYCVLHRRMAGVVVVAGEITQTGLGAGTSTGQGSSGTPVGSKSSDSSTGVPFSALVIAIPVAAGLGFGAGRRKPTPTPLPN